MLSATKPRRVKPALRTLCTSLLFLLLTATSTPVIAAELLAELPTQINASESYVFYSHGLIVEGDNPRPVHPEFGTYEFPAIAEALFASGVINSEVSKEVNGEINEKTNVIAHHRPAGTNADEYAAQLVNWVRHLVDAGVQTDHITLVGFSRGAQITLKASQLLNDLAINTAFMAVCFAGDFPDTPPIRLTGHVLSIYETTDAVQSCHKLLERSEDASSRKEIAISTGLKHGAFYTPRPEWLVPLHAWLAEPGQ